MDAQRLMEFLAQEGFRASLAGPRDVRFKYEGGNYMIRWAEDDDQWVAVAYPNFWAIESAEEKARALGAANRIVQTIKVGKVFVLEDQKNVWAEAEVFVERFEQFQALFPRTLSILKAAAAKFMELMRQSAPLPDKRIELRREDVTRWAHSN